MRRIFLVDSEPSAGDRADEGIRHLDELRSEFLVDLSHQLRTPVTAMKLAMDGLFSQIRDLLTPSQRNLAKISQRNIERVIALVENQLDLLQMMAGERLVCRRLSDLDLLLRGLPRRPFDDAAADRSEDDNRLVIERSPDLEASQSLYTFTDPDHLTAVIDCVLGVGAPSSTRRIHVDYDESTCSYQLDIRVDQPGRSSPAPGETAGGGLCAMDFESRAYRTMIERLGGSAVTEKDECRRWARIILPRYPDYDRQKDFVGPARRLRVASTSRRNTDFWEPAAVHFIRCDVAQSAARDYLSSNDDALRSFFDRIRTVVSGQDAVIRGREHGTIYLALASRTHQELEHVMSLLRTGNGGGPCVWNPQTILADEREIEHLVRDLELV
jgi:hypothetical protein